MGETYSLCDSFIFRQGYDTFNVFIRQGRSCHFIIVFQYKVCHYNCGEHREPVLGVEASVVTVAVYTSDFLREEGEWG